MTISPRNYSERPKKVVIARNVVTKQSPEIAPLCPVHHAVQGFARNDSSSYVYLLRAFTIADGKQL
jgi:hypothetical protein